MKFKNRIFGSPAYKTGLFGSDFPIQPVKGWEEALLKPEQTCRFLISVSFPVRWSFQIIFLWMVFISSRRCFGFWLGINFASAHLHEHRARSHMRTILFDLTQDYPNRNRVSPHKRQKQAKLERTSLTSPAFEIHCQPLAGGLMSHDSRRSRDLCWFLTWLFKLIRFSVNNSLAYTIFEMTDNLHYPNQLLFGVFFVCFALIREIEENVEQQKLFY